MLNLGVVLATLFEDWRPMAFITFQDYCRTGTLVGLRSSIKALFSGIKVRFLQHVVVVKVILR